MHPAWVAGFVDGEGSVAIPNGKNTLSPRISIPQSGDIGKAALNAIADWVASAGFPRPTVYTVAQAKTVGVIIQRKQMWTLHVANRSTALWMLEKMLPYLRIKRVAALDAIRFCKIYPPLRECPQAIKMLNMEARAKRPKKTLEETEACRREARNIYYLRNKKRIHRYANEWRRAKRARLKISNTQEAA